MSKYDQIIDLLWDSLKHDPQHSPETRMTSWGSKTKDGLVACIDHILAED
jgi:hypothetical protein